jgi:hypothetical protein
MSKNMQDKKLEFLKQCSFFIIGAPKCSTTSLALHLSEHPEIAFSDPKEPHYFSPDYPFGPSELFGLDDYLACFQTSSQTRILGEGSVWYLYSSKAIQRIEEFSDHQAKYIVCLRNPVDASFSLHAQQVAFGWEPERDYLTALQRSKEVDPKSVPEAKIAKVLQYRQLYSYSTYIERLLSQVDQRRVMFYVLERDGKKITEFYDCLHSFLCVSRRSVQTERRVNEARRVNNDWIYQLLTAPASLSIARWIRKTIAPQGFGLGRPIRQISSAERHIAQDLFAEDIESTSARVKFDSMYWGLSSNGV